MNKKISELYKKVNELMKANGNFDIKQFETVKADLEHLIGKELDTVAEEKMEKDFAASIQKALLKALDGNPSLDMISIVEQTVAQAGAEYRPIKSKYMNDAVDFFIDYLDFENTPEKETQEEDDEDEQS